MSSVQHANARSHSPHCLVRRLTVKRGGSLECGWNPFCRQEEISSRPCSVSLKNPVLQQRNTSSAWLKPLQMEAPPSVSEGARLSLLISSQSRDACYDTLLCPGHSSPQFSGCRPVSFHAWATTAQIRPPPTGSEELSNHAFSSTLFWQNFHRTT